jgi:hypothetical protein
MNTGVGDRAVNAIWREMHNRIDFKFFENAVYQSLSQISLMKKCREVKGLSGFPGWHRSAGPG